MPEIERVRCLNWEKHNKREEFYYKKSYLEHRLQKDVMEDGIAYIPCLIKKIISDEIPLEFFYVIFWLFADSFVRYLL